MTIYLKNNMNTFDFGTSHPMKPFRIDLTNESIIKYDLYPFMKIFNSENASKNNMIEYHDSEYINMLTQVTPNNIHNFTNNLNQYGLDTNDCPIFDGLYKFNQIILGSTITAASKLCKQECNIAINWNGGFHHAHKASASGFCYVNDIVIAILKLLKYV